MSQKCPFLRRPYAPGNKSKKRSSAFSEFAKELKEKQKIKNWYYLNESQFEKYVKEVLKGGSKSENVAKDLIVKLESRLDNAIFRLGFASSRAQARQLVTHGHFKVNGRKTDIPSRTLKIKDKISVREESKKKSVFKEIEAVLKNHKEPSWLKFDKKKLEAEVASHPQLEEVELPGELSTVFEYYSR